MKNLEDISLMHVNIQPHHRVINPNADWDFSRLYLEYYEKENRHGNYFAYTNSREKYLKMDIYPDYINIEKDVTLDTAYPLLYNGFKGFDVVVGKFPEDESAIKMLFNVYAYYCVKGATICVVFPEKEFYSEESKAKALRKDLESKSSFKIIDRDEGWLVIKVQKDTTTDLSIFVKTDLEDEKELILA